MNSPNKKIYSAQDLKNNFANFNFENNLQRFEKTKLGKFSNKILDLLVENFRQSYIVGGAVRDLLLSKKVFDVDMATEATPEQIIKLFVKHGVEYDAAYKNFGNVVVLCGTYKIDITTFRKDLAGPTRYPKTVYVKHASVDSKRRDFTINSLYLSLNKKNIFDPHQGLIDLKQGRLKFIGNPRKRITQDPLRIIRALRFARSLKLKIENKTYQAIKNNFSLLKNISISRSEKELNKISDPTNKKIVRSILTGQKNLDKYFKTQ